MDYVNKTSHKDRPTRIHVHVSFRVCLRTCLNQRWQELQRALPVHPSVDQLVDLLLDGQMLPF